MTEYACPARNRYMVPTFLLALALTLAAGRAAAQDAEEGDPGEESNAQQAVAPQADIAGLRIRNLSAVPRDQATAVVKFDISWTNSWRFGSFLDAAWVFFKVRGDEKTGWQHVNLSADKVSNPAGYGQDKDGTAIEFVVPEDRVGMFVRRAGDGLGLSAARNVTAILDVKSLKGVTDIAKAQIKAIGIEMVHIPEGAFYAGRGNGPMAPYAGKGYGGLEINWLYKHSGKPSDTAVPLPFKFYIGDLYCWGVGVTKADPPPYRIESEDPIPTGRKKGALWAVDITPEDGGEIPGAFPKGYAAFYCMKRAYPTAAQYAEFLNTLTEAQAKPRFYENGHGMAIKRSGAAPNRTYTAPNPDDRVPWLSFTDGAFFAAWAGLRPMTELEYEKMIRGPRPAIPNDATPSCWGVLDVMTLSTYERPASVGNAIGRAFRGTHGNGAPELPADWPPDIRGAIMRGDYFFGGEHCPRHLLIGGRAMATYANADRHGSYGTSGGPSAEWTLAGWRGARTAPAGDPAVAQVTGELDLELKRPAKLARPLQLDGSLDEWTDVKPVAAANSAAYIYPVHERFPGEFTSSPWRGPGDFSAKAWLATDGEALLIAAEVTDDKHVNEQTGKNIWNGDAMQIGLVNSVGAQWNIGAGLTASGVEFQQWDGPNEALLKSAKCAVKRDGPAAGGTSPAVGGTSPAGVTRYEFRLPLADFGVVPGQECSFYFIFFDCDGFLDWQGKPVLHRIQWVPERTEPFLRRNYPKFMTGE